MFSWNLDAKLVMTSFRKVEAGQPVYVLDRKSSGETERAGQATDMITFRCANELCDNFFPLKVCIKLNALKFTKILLAYGYIRTKNHIQYIL